MRREKETWFAYTDKCMQMKSKEYEKLLQSSFSWLEIVNTYGFSSTVHYVIPPPTLLKNINWGSYSNAVTPTWITEWFESSNILSFRGQSCNFLFSFTIGRGKVERHPEKLWVQSQSCVLCIPHRIQNQSIQPVEKPTFPCGGLLAFKRNGQVHPATQ